MRPRIPSPAPGSPRRLDAEPRALSRRRFLAVVGATALSLAFTGARAAADRIEVLYAAVEGREDGFYLNGDFEVDLKPRIAEALDRGLTLYFAVEIEATRSRWYWFDERPVNAALNVRLSYHALTRQYRVSTGNLQLGFPTLAEALGILGHVRDWKFAERSALKVGETYTMSVRMRLDTTQLPKPFQINALTSRDWTLESEWKRFGFEPR